MRLLALDIGTGTQDILLLDTADVVENAPQMIMPSPTLHISRQIEDATRQGKDILLTGSLMGGGPCAWAAEAHRKAGYKVYATERAALTFDDEIEKVKQSGVIVVSEDEAKRKKGKSLQRIEMKDLDVESIVKALGVMGAPTSIDGLAVGVLDHGNSPPGYSDRQFRFDHLKKVLESNDSLLAFAYLPQDLPDYLTRMKALITSESSQYPFVLLDTGVAAALGAMEDPSVKANDGLLLINMGNMHTLAFILHYSYVKAFFEHHTGFLNTQKLDDYLLRFGKGKLSHEEVFKGMGHGVLYLKKSGLPQKTFASLTGPKRHILDGSVLKPYLAAPYGSMMLTGCYGMARAFAHRYPQWKEEIEKALR